jgi:hypothetical protein
MIPSSVLLAIELAAKGTTKQSIKKAIKAQRNDIKTTKKRDTIPMAGTVNK